MPTKASAVDAYLNKLSAEKRATLEKVRKAIRAALPQAEEGMSYGMPAFIQGKPIAGYAASANHCAYYPMSGAVTEALKRDLKGYETSKGAIRFPVDKPLPAALIKKLTSARLAEIAEGEKPKKKAAQKRNARSLGQTDAAVIAFMRELDHPLKKELETARKIILSTSPAIREGIKWNVPSFRTSDYFATFNLRAKDAVELVFHTGAKVKPSAVKGVEVKDASGLARWLAKDRCLVTLGRGKEFQARRAAFEAFVRAWIEEL